MKIVLLTGYAKNGKDFLFKLLDEKYPLKFTRYAFADALKDDLKDFLWSKTKLDVWNLTGETKDKIRPLLVAYGCMQRDLGDGLHWVRKVEQQMWAGDEAYHNIPVITDCRFLNELLYFKEKHETFVVKVSRTINGQLVPPPNEEEARNQPLVDQYVDHHIVWETVQNPVLLNSYVETLYKKICEKF